MERVAPCQYLRARVPQFDPTPIIISKWYLHAVDVSTDEWIRFLTRSKNWMKIVDFRQLGRQGLSICEPVNQSSEFMNWFARMLNSLLGFSSISQGQWHCYNMLWKIKVLVSLPHR